MTDAVLDPQRIAQAEKLIAEAEKVLVGQSDAADRPLSPRQRAFVEEYVIDRNGKQAALRAGYAEESATSTASTLLTYPNVKAAVDRAIAQRESRVNITQESVLHEMSLLSNSNIDHYFVDDEGQVKPTPGAPEGVMRAIQSIKRKTRLTIKDGEVIGKTYDVEVRLWDKPTPLKLMGRHVGLFPDRVEHTGKDGGPIAVTEVRNTIVDPALPAPPERPALPTITIVDSGANSRDGG